MKSIFILLYAFIFSQLSSFAQDNTNFKVEQTQEASYPGGDRELYTFILKNLKYSEEAKKNKAEGEVMLSFYVEKDSVITNIKAFSGPDFGIKDSLKVMFSRMKYIPATENGFPIKSNVVLNIPVRAH